jgi:hypothetical protein
MSFDDFVQHFQRVNICHTHCTAGAHWMDCRHKGLVEYTEVGVRCPHFRIRVRRTGEAWISLHQDDERVLHAQPYIDLDFIVVRKDSEDKWEVVKRIHGRWDRQTQVRNAKDIRMCIVLPRKMVADTYPLLHSPFIKLHFDCLEQGEYFIVPYTSNIMRQREIHRRLEDIFDENGVINMTYLQVRRTPSLLFETRLFPSPYCVA